MSFGSESGRTRSGSKGFSSREKKLKKKKQDFHTHRRMRLQETVTRDPEEVRARTVLSLDRLGHQVLSTEPGGYDLVAWKKSFDSLLDDFEERVGEDRITSEFRVRRQEAALSLVPPAPSQDIELEIKRLSEEEASAKDAIAEAESTAAARRASLKDDREACNAELKTEREKLSQAREARKYRPFFSRLLGSGPSLEQGEKRVAELEAKLKALDEEIDKSRKARAVGEGGSQEANLAYREAQAKLGQVQSRLLELRTAMEARKQLAKEREIATQTIAGIISSMDLGGAASEGGMGKASTG